MARVGSSGKQGRASEYLIPQYRSELPGDPDDPRLSVDGAALDADGKINVGAYTDLQAWYAGEPPPSKHPYPDRPGVHVDEEVPRGLRIWDDLWTGGNKRQPGAGWIVSRQRSGEPKRDKWFNIRTCGSWRLAFILARLQRDVWEFGGGRAKSQPTPKVVLKRPASAKPGVLGEAGVTTKRPSAKRDFQALGNPGVPVTKRPSARDSGAQGPVLRAAPGPASAKRDSGDGPAGGLGVPKPVTAKKQNSGAGAGAGARIVALRPASSAKQNPGVFGAFEELGAPPMRSAPAKGEIGTLGVGTPGPLPSTERAVPEVVDLIDLDEPGFAVEPVL